MKWILFFTAIVSMLFVESGMAKPKIVASKPTTAAQVDILTAIRKKYSNYEQINMKVSKTSHIAALDKTKTSPQMIFVTNRGEIRVDTNEVPKSVTILANNRALVIDDPDPDFGGPMRVLVSKSSNLKQSQAFLSVLFGQGELEKFYKAERKDDKTYDLTAVDANLSAQRVQLKLNAANLQIQEIIYWDELQNKVSLNIETTAFLKARNAKLFDYKIPKNAEVTEI